MTILDNVLPIRIAISILQSSIDAADDYVSTWTERDGGVRYMDRGGRGDRHWQLFYGKVAEFTVAGLLCQIPDTEVRELSNLVHSADLQFDGRPVHVKAVAEPYQYPHARGWVFEKTFVRNVLGYDDILILTSVNLDLQELVIHETMTGRNALKRAEPFRLNAENFPSKLAIYECAAHSGIQAEKAAR